MQNKYCQTSVNFVYDSKHKPEILIGRDKSCDIQLNWDKTFSKFQVSLIWDEFLEQWKIVDGGPKGISRNGTWIFTSKSFEIHDECVFKIENSKIKIKLASSQQPPDESEGNL